MYDVCGNRVIVNHHPGQWQAWQSPAQNVAIISGTQGGKTIFGPHWLRREIQQSGPGDYLVATPTFPLLNLKLLPEFRKLFEDVYQLGKYVGSPSRQFRISPFGQRRLFGNSGTNYTTNIFFGHANDPESLESATAKAAWLDEAGQKKFKSASYEAIQRRLAIHQGRTLLTTTPYSLNWLYSRIYQRRSEPHIDVINFASTMNPTFPLAEYEWARSELPDWKFRMFYNGEFTRPAGAIFNCFDETHNTCNRFPIPPSWPIYIGVDFGATNTAAVYIAEDTTNSKFYLFRTYHGGNASFQSHATRIKSTYNPITYGGAPSETQERREYRKYGLHIRNPKLSSVEIGIDRIYAALKTGKLIIFNDLSNNAQDIESMDIINQIMVYSRKLNDEDKPTMDIEDKNRFHLVDALRYICGYLFRHIKPPSDDTHIDLNL